MQYKNIHIHFTDSGSGKAIVLLHGFLENTSMWKNIAPTLSKQYRVIAIDLLGHGKTESLGYIHTMQDMSEIVEAVLNHLNISKSIIIGHSMGGYVALAYAENHLEKVAGLCLMNSTAEADSEERKLNRDRAIKAVKQNHRTFVSMAVANLFATKNRENLNLAIEFVKNEALKTPLQGIIAALEGMKIRPDKTDFFKSAPIKKLLILGKKDPVLNFENTKNHVKNSNVNIVEFPDGHMSHIENENNFLQEIMHFIENI